MIRTDLFLESVLALLKRNFLFVVLLPLWFLKGKAYLKHQIAKRVDINARLLPYNGELLDYLKAEHVNGRRLILATASNQLIAEDIARSLGIFQEVLASTANVNLSEKRKLQRLQDLFGEDGFEFARNARVDFELREHATDFFWWAIPREE